MIRKLMVPVRGDGKGDGVFAHAAVLAKAFGAHVQVVHCQPKAEDMMPFGVVIPDIVRRQIEQAANENAGMNEAHIRSEFKALADRLGLPVDAPAPGKATASLEDYAGKQVDAVKHYGRLADLVCVPRPDRAMNLGANTLKAAIYGSGRPVLMCPPGEDAPATIGKHVTIGWNGSLEATRALAQGMAIVAAAESVTILTTGAEGHAASAEDLVAYLALHGVTAQIHRFEKSGLVGDSLLAHSADLGADLLLMGAYHDSYERETIFGGNTQSVVSNAEIPVMLVH
ncbi:MAG: universal stress protein [Pseudomonadota bacterium]